ncbi:MAG: YqeG family HAD IIIA-type phosphatase [Erysipelotrichaceae bacterium]
MLRRFQPTLCVNHYLDIKMSTLNNYGCRYLFCDIDNTLVAYYEKTPNEQVENFLKVLKENDITIILISNNTLQRVSTFAKEIDAPYYHNATKPLKRTYKKIIEDFNISDLSTIVCLGDQLMTDIYGANKMHLKSILTKPMVTKDLFCTKLNRFLERHIFQSLKKRGLINEQQ